MSRNDSRGGNAVVRWTTSTLGRVQWIAALIGLVLAAGASADPVSGDVDLLSLSVEDLLQIEVTTVSKRATRLSQTPAAVQVITSEDIRRSGVTNVPDLLRMVPGLHVASIDSSSWAITARGFNSQFANKLLVMIDGRSVYTPLFSGVYWDVQDLMLEDIERIEVVRGPGGTIWGANAVNGVIDIITKKASDTQGLLVTATAGNLTRVSTSARYGGAIGDRAHYRAYVRYYNRGQFDNRAGVNAHDAWDVARGGARIDWDVTDSDRLSIHGGYYEGESDETTLTLARSDADLRGGNAVVRWTHIFSESSELQATAWYDRTERYGLLLGEHRDTFDAELRHSFEAALGWNVNWGANYRVTTDKIRNSAGVNFDPRRRTVNLVSGFVQTDVPLVEDRLALILGTKLEYNDYSGLEVLPSARMLWTPAPRHSAWAAVSRAVRAPNRAENDVSLLVPQGATPPQFTLLQGDNDFESEDLLAFEMGYRAQPLDDVLIDIAGYYNLYENVRSVESGATIINFPGPGLVTLPLSAQNHLDAHGYGVETSATWSVLDNWRLIAGYTFMKLDIKRRRSTDPTAQGQEDDTPENQFHVRSLVDLPCNLQLDTALYWVDRVSNQQIDDYARLDVRLGWRPIENLELSVAGQNLTESSHDEFGPSFTRLPTSVPRSFYGKVTWSY